MKELVFIFLGSGLGGLTRYGLGKWVSSFHTHYFPFSTLVVNIIACLVLGFIIGLADYKQLLSATTRLFWVIGFCGGFSTFSTFSSETLALFESGHNISAIFYIFASVLMCISATFGGLLIVQKI